MIWVGSERRMEGQSRSRFSNRLSGEFSRNNDANDNDDDNDNDNDNNDNNDNDEIEPEGEKVQKDDFTKEEHASFDWHRPRSDPFHSFPTSSSSSSGPPSRNLNLSSSVHQKSRSRSPSPQISPSEIRAPLETLEYGVHLFYYVWYKNPETDGDYAHWNHHLLQHWDESIAKQYPKGQLDPRKDDLGSCFFPLRGPYSSFDPNLIREHMQEISSLGAGVIVMSWWGRNLKEDTDGEGVPTPPQLVSRIMDTAKEYAIKIIFHLEPYTKRTAASTLEDIKYLVDTYGEHPAFYRDPERGDRPWFYLYDSYHISKEKWLNDCTSKIRATPYDSVLISLVLSDKEKDLTLGSHFDGVYTYFASSSFTAFSKPSNWRNLVQWASEHSLITSLSVAPGYDDTRIRPWNSANTKSREHGKYYRSEIQAALEILPEHKKSLVVSVTSFNEWGESTQIEPVLSSKKSLTGYQYQDYEKDNPHFYLELTQELVQRFTALVEEQ